VIRPNVLLVVLDATRADACSCYGAPQPTTPALDRLAAQGTLYEQAISPAPWTLPSFASLFTGYYPNQLGIYEQRRLSPSLPTLASLLSAQGYATFAISGNSWMSTAFGLGRGFQRFFKLWQILQTTEDVNEVAVLDAQQESSKVRALLARRGHGNPARNLANAAYNRLWAYRRDYGARRILRPLRAWTRAQEPPWFALIHYMEAHLDFKPPPAWSRRFVRNWDAARSLLKEDQIRLAWRYMSGVESLSEERLAGWHDLYLAEVAYADWHLGNLIRALEEDGSLDDTVVIVTADHGESLGEHGLLSHQYGLYDTLVRVPLVIRFPRLFPAGCRIQGQVQTLDLFATLLALAGVEAQPGPSRPLPPLSPDPRPFTVAQYGATRVPHATTLRRYGLRPEDIRQRGFTMLREDKHKLIVSSDGQAELYAWREDPGEETNVAARQPEVLRQLQARLRQWQEQTGDVRILDVVAPAEMDPGTASRLRALGYIE
jgi:arylsulfatase A-like enzyme